MSSLPATLLDTNAALAGRPPVPVRTNDPATARAAA